MFLEIKNEARNGREGWKGRLQKECRETELQEAVKRMPLTPTVTENKLMYQVLAHPENTAMMQLVHFLLWANSKRQRCIESIRQQTDTNWELLVLDDHSTDGTTELVLKLAEEDSRILPILRQKNGVSAARNEGLEKAQGEFIMFVDADDKLDPQMLSVLRAMLGQKATLRSVITIDGMVNRTEFITGQRSC